MAAAAGVLLLPLARLVTGFQLLVDCHHHHLEVCKVRSLMPVPLNAVMGQQTLATTFYCGRMRTRRFTVVFICACGRVWPYV
jgi:hypothetical protein